MRPSNSFGDGALVLDGSLFALNVSRLKKKKRGVSLQVSLEVVQDDTCGAQTAHSLHSRTPKEARVLHVISFFWGGDLSACDVPALPAVSQGKK